MQACKKCLSLQKQKVILICNHTLCLSCAQAIKIIQGKTQIDSRIKITCPSCYKSTLTYSMQNVTIGTQQSNILMNQINKKNQLRNEIPKKRQIQRLQKCFKHGKQKNWYQPLNKLIICQDCKHSGTLIRLTGDSELLNRQAKTLKQDALNRLKDLSLNQKILQKNIPFLKRAKQQSLNQIRLIYQELKQLINNRQISLQKTIDHIFFVKKQQILLQSKDIQKLHEWIQQMIHQNDPLKFIQAYGPVRNRLKQNIVAQTVIQPNNTILFQTQFTNKQFNKVLFQIIHFKNQRFGKQNLISINNNSQTCSSFVQKIKRTQQIKRPQSQLNNYASKKKQNNIGGKKVKTGLAHRKNSLR